MDSSRALSLWIALCFFFVVLPLARSNHNGSKWPRAPLKRAPPLFRLHGSSCLPFTFSLLLSCVAECPTLHVPFYGVLVHNATWLTSDQPEWIENSTVTLQCDRGYELVDAAGESAGGSLNVTCGENATWSDDSGNYTCSSE